LDRQKRDRTTVVEKLELEIYERATVVERSVDL
jgi:hypothetical protein